MLAFASDHYTVPLPPGHPFPMGKYGAARTLLISEGTLRAEEVRDPGLLSREEMCAAHDAAWVEAILTLQVAPEMEKRIGIPVDRAFSNRARAAGAGTLAAARAALREGIASNLAGGTHHAGPARGAGFCIINDLAITTKVLLSEQSVRRVAIVDLDVHQGDGTAEILANDRRVFTFSMHGEKNFPRIKIPGTLDVALPDGAGDDLYLSKLHEHLPGILLDFAPDLVLYQAGVDSLAGDRFGRLALTLDGLRERDRSLIAAVRKLNIPLVSVFGGGYGRDLSRTVEAHANTVREAVKYYNKTRGEL